MKAINSELMSEVAKLLGLKFENPDNREDNWRGFLVGDNIRIFVNATWAKDEKYYMSGSYPQNKLGQNVRPWIKVGDRYEEPTAPEISFSPTKGAQKIASDVKARFMPNYIRYRDLVLARIKSDNEYWDGIDGTVKKVCASLGIKPPKELGTTRICAYDAKVKKGYDLRDLEAHEGGKRVKVCIEGPTDEMLQLLETIKK